MATTFTPAAIDAALAAGAQAAASVKPQTAHEAYVAKHAELMLNITRLQARINARAVRGSLDINSWGHVGDLSRINEMIKDALGEQG